MHPPLSSSPTLAPKCLSWLSRRQRSSSFPRPTCSDAHRCSRLTRQNGGEQSGPVPLTFDLKSGARCSAARDVLAPTREEESGGCISWRHAHLQLVYINSVRGANRLSGELSLGRIVCGARRPLGETSMGQNVLPWGEVSMGRNVRGVKSP